jgi:hypothetical protein
LVFEYDQLVPAAKFGVLEQLPYGDLPAVIPISGDDAGQPMVNRVVQGQPPRTDQLQYDRADKGFGRAAGPEIRVFRYRTV